MVVGVLLGKLAPGIVGALRAASTVRSPSLGQP